MKRDQILKFGRYVYKINEISTQPFVNEVKWGENTEIELDLENASKIKMTEGLRTLEDHQTENRVLNNKEYNIEK